MRLVWFTSAVLALAGALHAIWRGPAWLDSAFVSFRYGDHLASGHGLVFNVGQRVEGFFDPLWTLAWAGAQVLGIDPAQATVFVGPGLLAVLIVLLAWLSVRAVGEQVGLIAPMMLAAWPPAAASARTGADDLFVAVLLAAALMGRIRDADAPECRRTSVVWLVLLSLTGISGGILALLLAVVGPSMRPGRVWVRLRAVGMTWACLSLCRWLYYGDLVPNSWRSLGTADAARLSRGGGWLLDLLQTSPVLVILTLVGVVLALFGRRNRGYALGMFSATVVVCVPWLIAVAPSKLAFFQPLMVIVVPMLVLASIPMAALWQPLGRLGWLMALAVLASFGALDGAQTHERAGPLLNHRKIRMKRGRAMGRFLSLRFDNQAQQVAFHQPGIMGFYTQGPVLDLSGQTDPDLVGLAGRKEAIRRVLETQPAVVVHPKMRGGRKPGRLRTPDWYPPEFGDTYTTVSFSARKRWRLVEHAGPYWLHLFVRRGVAMGHDETKWIPKEP